MEGAGRSAARRAGRWAAWAVLWLAAAVGVALSAAAILAALPATRPIAAATLIRWVDDALAGSFSLDEIAVLPRGAVELRGLRVLDPEGRQVLRVERARVFADLSGISDRALGVTLELEGADVDAALRSEDGTLALARAFAPSSRASKPKAAPAPGERPKAETGGGGWTLRLGRLTLVQGRVRAEGAGAEPIDVSALSLAARGLWGPRDAWVELRLDGTMSSPTAAPLTVELRASRHGDAVVLERLAVGLGEDQLEAGGEGDPAQRTGRLALTRLGLSRSQAGALAPAARLGGDLSGTLYAESDGTIATAALSAQPTAAEATGRAQFAIAALLSPAALSWGLFADVDRLDPSRLSLLAPPGSVTLRGRGAAKGRRLADLAGRVDLRVERSRLRGGELGPISFTATAGGGDVEITKLAGAAPGGEVSGRLRWREGRAVDGRLALAFADLGRFGKNLGELLGRRLPAFGGTGRAELTLSGSSRAPKVDATVDAPRLVLGALRAERARLKIDLEGPEAALTLAANIPDLGPDPVSAEVRGRFGPERRTFDFAALAVAWPGTRFALAGPARLDLVDPSVDRLVLAAGAERIEAEGGVRRNGKVEGRVRLVALDLARLPRGLVPADAALEGTLTLDARASGTRAAPRIDATVGLTGASAYEIGGLQLLGDVAWDGELDRVEADLGLVRARGGAVDLSFDLPTGLGRARPYEEIRVELHGREVPLDEVVWLAGSYALISGDVEVTATLSGSVGAPELRVNAHVRNGAWEELEALDADATLDAVGERLRLRASGSISGAPAASAELELGFDLARLLARPRDAMAAARRAPATLALRLPDVALAPLAGRLELPRDLAGRVNAEARLGGTLSAPRGTARLTVAGGAGWGARGVGAALDVALAPDRSGATLDLQLAGKPAARLDGRIDLPAERLLDRPALAAAPIRIDAAFPRSDLAAWGGELVALRGTVEGRGALRGTPGAPQWELSLSAADAGIEGRPLGALKVDGRHAESRTTVDVQLQPPAGGSLVAKLALERPLGLGAQPGPILSAPAEATLRAERLDLGFLPALAPGVVRTASGAANIDLHAAGPLGELRPRGTIRIAKGRLAVAELGTWTDATIEAELGEDSVELRRFDLKKGAGRLELSGTLRGLSKPGVPAELEAKLRTADFGVERAGMEFVKVDLEAEGRGTLTRHELTLGVVVAQGEVKLPRRIPRTLQEIDTRKDIAVGRPKPPRRLPRGAVAAPEAADAVAPPEAPFKTVLHVLAPRRLRVRADQPRIDVELKADVILAFAGSRSEANGSIQVVRGQVEPIGGRVFVLERGKVAFGGGPAATGTIDLVARYDNPRAVVRATVAGTVAKPQLQLTSDPPLEEAQIAMLVATGRTELKAGAGGVNTLAAGDAGLAAAGAVLTGVFKDLLSDKLPVDSVSLDSTAVTAGKYLTDRIYVGYVRRFDAKPEKGENPDEVRLEYHLAPGWQVETRYGSGQSGGASIVWTRSY